MQVCFLTVGAINILVTGCDILRNQKQVIFQPHPVTRLVVNAGRGAVLLIIRSDCGSDAIPQRGEVADLRPVFFTIQSNASRNRLHAQVCVAAAIQNNGVRLILACDIPDNGIRILHGIDRDKVRDLRLKLFQLVKDPVEIQFMEIRIGEIFK